MQEQILDLEKPDNYLWYLGLSEEVCKYEARGKIGSMAKFVKAEGTNPMFVIDLTQDGLFVDSFAYEKSAMYFGGYWCVAIVLIEMKIVILLHTFSHN